MTTSTSYIAHLEDRWRGIPDLRFRAMFGEYGVYVGDKMVAMVCDQSVYVKLLPRTTALLGADAPTGHPYPGAKPAYLLSDTELDDVDRMRTLFDAVASATKPTRGGRGPARGAPGAAALAIGLAGVLAAAAPAAAQPRAGAAPSPTYPQLLALFEEWRAFEEPPRVEGAPDYSSATNARRLEGLRRLQQRLAAIDTTGWSIPEQVDHHLVRAEMNGMQYHLTVLQPFARDPAWYASVRTDESDTPAEEGPTIHGAIRLWQYGIWPRTVLDTVRPLTPDEAGRLSAELRTVPPLLRQARVNLANATARDLWVGGVRAFEEQAEALATLRERVERRNPRERALLAAIADARGATDAFAQWLRDEAPRRTGPSGIGREQYTWFLRNVLLVPLSWEEELTITRRELARAHAALRLEEHRNRALPPLPVAESAEQFAAMQARAIPKYLAFMRDREILTMEPWMERALRERIPGWSPPATRNFFAQATHRDPIPLWTHLYHWWDNMRIRVAPHPSPIRRGPLRYNVWMSRAEGMATVMEEWMMHAGLYDDSPRSREIVWIMLITRAARGLGNLHAHANTLTMAEAGDIHVSWTPRGWMRRDPLLGFEQHLYLRQPGYGASYVTGGRLLEEAMAMRARQLGDAFTLRRFLDEVNAAGMIPVSLIYWELTGDDRMIRELRDGPLPFRTDLPR
jgi:TfoX/Sxy family transcriptional regulator of competence genes